MPSQNDRVLAALRHAGPTGITRIDFFAPNVCDGGDPIVNLPGRIHDLQHKRGYVIDASGTRHSCAVYVLKGQGVSSGPVSLGGQPVAEAGSDETSTLFDPVVTHRPLSPYDKEAA